MERAVVVFTRDLRVRDHPGLVAACRSGSVVPLFVVDDAIVRTARNANRLQFLVDSLVDLHRSLRERDGALVVRRGNWVDEVVRVVVESGAGVVHLSADGSGYARRRDAALRDAGAREGFRVEAHPGVTVVPAGDLLTGSGTPFQMFTPYYRRWIAARWRRPLAPPSNVAFLDGVDAGILPTLATLTTAIPSPDVVRGGERLGLARTRAWARSSLAAYAARHDDVAADGTARLSAYLHFGCLSPLEVATRLRKRPGAEPFIRQLAWRDFFHQLLASRPELAHVDLRSRGVPSGEVDAAFRAWQAGRTGYPLVDAGMRQLRQEGFMHNRVRMVAASFLTKDLDVAWQLGARHFMDVLVDGDVANNQLNWQWVAGTGTDANPRYIRRYVSELADVDTALIHDPPPAERARLGYPRRIVEHGDAVAAYRARLTR